MKRPGMSMVLCACESNDWRSSLPYMSFVYKTTLLLNRDKNLDLDFMVVGTILDECKQDREVVKTEIQEAMQQVADELEITGGVDVFFVSSTTDTNVGALTMELVRYVS